MAKLMHDEQIASTTTSSLDIYRTQIRSQLAALIDFVWKVHSEE